MSAQAPIIEITEELIKERLELIPYSDFLGVKPLLMGDELTMVMPFVEQNIGNPLMRALHGGSVSAFMEITAIIQLALKSEGTRLPKPISLNIDYLRRGLPKDTYARARVSRKGNRVASVNVMAWQDNFDSPISSLNGHFMLARDD